MNVHETRIDNLNALDTLKAEYLKCERRERRWKSVRPKFLAAPLLTACVLVSPGIKNEIKHHVDRTLGTEAASVFAAAGGFLLADARRRAAFSAARNVALSGVRQVSELGIATPDWVDRGLQPDIDPNPVDISETV